MAFCSNCGAQLKEGASFCVNCGARVNAAPAGGAPVGSASYGAPTPSGNPYSNAPAGQQPGGGTPVPPYGQVPYGQAPYGQAPYEGYGYQGQPVPAKSSGKKIWIFGIGAAVLVGVAVLLILLLGRAKTELTMDAFIDKYIEAYKTVGSYDYYVDEDDESFRSEILEDVDTLSGKASEDNFFGASEELYVRIKREDDPNIRLYFVVYPDESTAEDAFPQMQEALQKSGGDKVDISHSSEGRNAESLTIRSSDSDGNYVRIVRVGKTLLMIYCSDGEETVNAVFDIFGY